MHVRHFARRRKAYTVSARQPIVSARNKEQLCAPSNGTKIMETPVTKHGAGGSFGKHLVPLPIVQHAQKAEWKQLGSPACPGPLRKSAHV